MIPHDYIEELVRRSDIAEVVGGYVQLKRKGRLYAGLCPFHNEKTPSFYLYPETQSFYCFGCGAGGDVISFIKQIEGLSYPEAVKFLAERAGMPAPEEDDGAGRMRSRILSMNKEDKTIARFGLGYAPNDGQALYRHLRDKGYTQAEMDASGLFKRSQAGRIYCLFWRRVITPIFDLRGNVIAFGGRVLDDSKPKYVNSPETMVYHKSETVFALQMAKKSPSRRYVLCEGYMDVISMQQAGIDTAVCACGTALTQGQVRLLSEYADEVILCYDSDEAGQKATARSLDLFRQTQLQVGVLTIPGAKDPDEYIKKYGPDRFRQLLDGAAGALDFRLARAKGRYDLAQTAQRLEYIRAAAAILADGTTPTERELYAGRVAEETGLSRTAVLAQVEDAARAAGARRRAERRKELIHSGEMDTLKLPRGQNGQGALGVVSAVRRLVTAALRQPDLLPQIAAGLAPENIPVDALREGYEAILAVYRAGREVNLGSISGLLSDDAVHELSAAAAEYSDVPCTPQDIELYLARALRSAPLSAQAAALSADEVAERLQRLAQRKGAAAPGEED